ncbi:MAG: hypothetical protein JXR96_17220 [Deltaproteobacteria bacterium]|nr:hypothetical protein [Deltaproteobacteria bacterium]
MLGLAASAEAGPLHDRTDCQRLFGDQARIERNRAERHAELSSVQEGSFAIQVVHSVDWSRPASVEFDGLQLVETYLGPGRQPTAVFELSEDLAPPGCQPGLYALRKDDAIGKRCQVLAVLHDLVLLEVEGQLGYVLEDDEPEPIWRLIWRSPWKLIRLPGERRSSSGRRSHPRRRPRRKR